MPALRMSFPWAGAGREGVAGDLPFPHPQLPGRGLNLLPAQSAARSMPGGPVSGSLWPRGEAPSLAGPRFPHLEHTEASPSGRRCQPGMGAAGRPAVT